MCDQSQEIQSESRGRLELGSASGVRYTTRVISFDRSRACDRSRAYDWSHVFRPESGYTIGFGHTTSVMRYLYYKHV
jgi:hypothetical protein